MNLVIPNSYSDRCEPKFTNSAQPGIWKMKWNDMARGAMNYGESTTKFGKSLKKYDFFGI